jgi:polyisoprenyl-phosphate glycosyltransferase
MDKPFISIVSPVYRAESLVDLLVYEIKKEVKQITDKFEIILVDDGSPDNSWQKIEENALADSKVKGIKLSRNFGQHYAITAGLDFVKGEWIVVMDCDLQDKPSEIKKLYNKAQEGYDLVLARREIRKDSYNKKLFSRLFYNSLGYLTGTKQDPAVANFGIYNKKSIDAVKSMREPIRYFPTMVKWVGFKRGAVNVEHGAREAGTSTYNLKKLLKLAMDIILANSDKPIKLTIKTGLLVAFISFLFGLITLYRYFSGKIVVLGYTSLLISVWFLSGMILMVLGILGLYLGKTFEGVKQRPIYIIKEHINAH